MQKIVFSLFLFVFSLFGFYGLATAQSSSNAVLLLATDNPQTVVDNVAYYDLVLNTLGNQVNEIDVQFLIRGPFDRQSLTFNLHPEHRNRVQVSAPLSVIDYQNIYENEDGVRVRVVLRSSSGKPFNEGSGAIPVFRVGLVSNNPGTIVGYIDSSHSYVRYTDASKNDYDNYTTESRPKTLSVIGEVTPSLPVATSTPTPTASATPVMTKTPTPTPTSAYDQEFARVSEEIAELKNKVEEQEQRVSLLEKFMRSLREFFAGLFN
jgi:hypothetical protein